MHKYVKPLNTISTADVGDFGGKSSSLGEMIQHGIPVPPGFAISAQAHRDFQDAPFSDTFKKELSDTFERLKLDRVAVRSSAIAEDSADASWAGQLETYLNVTFEDLEEYIRKCWDSIGSNHAQTYARQHDTAQKDLFVGVAVQSMAQSDVAGVLFTVDPISQDEKLLVLESIYGLGELLVQGTVTPDRYTVDTEKWAVIDTVIGQKDRKLVFQDGANKEEKVSDQDQQKSTLTEEQVITLAKLCKRIEQHYQAPQDIEWSLVGDSFYIVQSRPITSLT